jgi:RHS repeat-associated protein
LTKVGCRYYDPQVGSFTTRDTCLDQKPYLYCEHDPVNYLDPSGHDTLSELAGSVSGKLGAGTLLDAFGVLTETTGSNPTPFGFVGSPQYQADSDSGLILLGERYYDPSIGRFVSSDPIHDGGNWYAYCDNNPVSANDPLGLQSTKWKGPPLRNQLPNSTGDGKEKWKQHNIPSNNEKAAKDKATGRSGTGQTPIHHPNDKDQDPHYHAKNGRGKKIPGEHYTYPRKGPLAAKKSWIDVVRDIVRNMSPIDDDPTEGIAFPQPPPETVPTIIGIGVIAVGIGTLDPIVTGIGDAFLNANGFAVPAP